MRQGLVVLLFASVAATIFFSPVPMQQGPHSTEPPSQASSPADARLVPSTALDVCKVEQDPSCGKCGPGAICPGKELLETIEDFFGSSKSLDALNECGTSKPDAPSVWGVPPNVAKRMHFVLAIVPDPAHTHLSLFFDRQVEAIQQAAQEGGYNFARAHLPWSAKERPEPADLRARLLQNEYARNREKLPGLLMFRRTAPQGLCDAMEPLFVFIVGETPTGGINKAQFGMALRAIKDIRDGGEASASPKPLYVMGPTFAGSLYSLRFLLRQMPKDSFPYTVIHSGTISSSKTIEWFNTFKFKDEARPEFRFRTFQESDCYAMAQLTAFLKQQVGPGNVAVLSEDESAYGEELCNDSSDVMQVHFPRDISALRSAYERDIRNETASRNSAMLPARSTLRSNLEDNGNDDDSVPPFSRLQTPLSEEALLMGIVSNLQKHHTHFIVIRATNPLDALFLSRYLRNSYPEGRIITIGADLRFQREIDEPKLHGILAITPYSLLPGADDHIAVPSSTSRESHSHRVFPSSMSVGTFNATLSLLRCDAPNQQNGDGSGQTATPPARQSPESLECKTLPVGRYAEYGWPILGRSGLVAGDLPDQNGSNALVPPLWLTGLGNNGYWPVAILQSGDKECPPDDATVFRKTNPNEKPASLLTCLNARPDWNPGSPKEEKTGKVVDKKPGLHTPLPWKTLFWSGIATAVVFLFLLWKGSLISTSDISANFAPLKIHGAPRNLVFFVIDLLLLLMLLALSWPWMFWGRNFVPNGWGLLLIAVIFLVVFVGFKDLQRRGSPVYAWIFLVTSLVATTRSCLLAWGQSTIAHPFGWAMAVFIALLMLVGFFVLRKRQSGEGRRPMDASVFIAGSLVPITLNFFLVPADSAMTQPFMMYRLIHITSGLSPLVPLLLLLVAGLWWAWYTLGALVVLDERRPRLPLRKDLQLVHGANEDRSRIQFALNEISQDENLDITRLMKPNSFDVWLYAPPILFLMIAGTTIEFLHPVKSLEARYFDSMYGALLGFMSAVLILGLSRLALIWLELRKLLNQLDALPLRRSFERLEGFTWKPMWRLGSGALQDSFRFTSRQFDSLDHLLNYGTANQELTDAITAAQNMRNEVAKCRQEAGDEYKKSKDQKKSRWPVINFLRNLFEPQPSWVVDSYAPYLEKLQKQLALTCGTALKHLTQVWEKEDNTDLFEVAPRGNKEQQTKEPKEKPDTQLAEQFVCLFYLNFILRVIFRMRTLLMSAAGIYVFVLFSFSSYPFEPRSSFHVIMIILFFLVVGTVGVVLAQMHRNGTLSRITNTVPGELGMDFWLRLSAFIAVPLFSLLAAQFPGVVGTLSSWLESLQSFK